MTPEPDPRLHGLTYEQFYLIAVVIDEIRQVGHGKTTTGWRRPNGDAPYFCQSTRVAGIKIRSEFNNAAHLGVFRLVAKDWSVTLLLHGGDYPPLDSINDRVSLPHKFGYYGYNAFTPLVHNPENMRRDVTLFKLFGVFE